MHDFAIHSNTHGDEHEHHHDHDHHHDHHDHHHDAPEHLNEQEKRAFMLMNYMYHHNTEHTDELAGMAEQLRALGKDEAAALIEEAIASYRAGNEQLHHALHHIG